MTGLTSTLACASWDASGAVVRSGVFADHFLYSVWESASVRAHLGPSTRHLTGVLARRLR